MFFVELLLLLLIIVPCREKIPFDFTSHHFNFSLLPILLLIVGGGVFLCIMLFGVKCEGGGRCSEMRRKSGRVLATSGITFIVYNFQYVFKFVLLLFFFSLFFMFDVHVHTYHFIGPPPYMLSKHCYIIQTCFIINMLIRID